MSELEATSGTRGLRLLVTAIAITWSSLFAGPASHAAGAMCSVENARTGTKYSTLQSAVDATRD